jgi:PPOX class probable F420-dependent enzyme
MDTIPEKFEDILHSTALANVATIGPKGEPQNNPVWFDWDGERIRFSQVEQRQKYRNIQREPRVALSIVDPQNPYRYLEVRGRVERVEPDREGSFMNRLAKKYTGQDTYAGAVAGEKRYTIIVRPEHTTYMG